MLLFVYARCSAAVLVVLVAVLVVLVGVVGLVPAIVSVAWGTAAAGIGHQGIGGTLDSGCVSVSTYCLNP